MCSCNALWCVRRCEESRCSAHSDAGTRRQSDFGLGSELLLRVENALQARGTDCSPVTVGPVVGFKMLRAEDFHAL